VIPDDQATTERRAQSDVEVKSAINLEFR